MRSLQDSSPLLGDPPALRRRLREDGYLFLPGLLDADAAGRVGTDIARVLARHGLVEDDTGRVSRAASRRLVGGRVTAAVYAELQSLESLHRLVCDDTVADAVRTVLGPAFVHPHRLVRTTMPVHSGGPTSPAVHRDYPNWRVPDMITAWCPLASCPPPRGGLCVMEGSHLGRLDHPDDLSGGAWATASYEPGDVLLMHCYTVHGALPNITRQARLSVDARWQRLRDPMPAWSALPDRGDAWPAYTRGWSSTAWVELPKGATVVADDEEWAPLTELPQSALLSEVE